MQIINRKNNLFVVDKSLLNNIGKRSENINALYAVIYDEFFGASENKKYSSLTNSQRIQALNDFATDWLRKNNMLV